MIDLAGFVLFLALVVGASALLGRILGRLGVRFHLTEGILGLLTALAADTPEISTAIVAMAQGKAELGTGVVLGSNLFNLAALLGVSALVAGKIRVPRSGFGWIAGSAIVVAAIGTATVLGVIAPALAALGLVLVLFPYVTIAALRPATIATLPRKNLLRRLSSPVLTASDAAVEEAHARLHAMRRKMPMEGVLLLVTLVAIVGGSIGLVHEAEPLAARAHIPMRFTGPLLLAGLTGIPNAVAALKLARDGRGSALVSEAFNSNTINVVVGICLPALVMGVPVPSRGTTLTAWWLAGATTATIALIAIAQKIGRWEGGLIVAFYVAFVIAFVAG